MVSNDMAVFMNKTRKEQRSSRAFRTARAQFPPIF